MIVTWSKGAADDNMPEDLLLAVFEKVRRHPWWHARARLAVAILQKESVLPPARVLEAGCGWGTNLEALAKAGYRVDGLDISRRALEVIDRPDRRLIEADLTQEVPTLAEPYDALLALDVIEHLDDDRAAVRRLGALVRPGGLVVVSVPALPELFSDYDRIQGHRRRYVPNTLQGAFADSDLKVTKIFWWGAWMVRVLQRMRSSAADRQSAPKTYSDYLRIPPWPVPWLMRLLYAVEQPRTLQGRLRTGTSLFAISRRAMG